MPPLCSGYTPTDQKGKLTYRYSPRIQMHADHLIVCRLTFPDSLPVSEGGLKPSQEISLLSTSAQAGEVTEYPLKVSVFADVVSLSLFFGGTEGGERTRI